MRIAYIKFICFLIRLDISTQTQSTSNGTRTTWVIKKKRKKTNVQANNPEINNANL